MPAMTAPPIRREEMARATASPVASTARGAKTALQARPVAAGGGGAGARGPIRPPAPGAAEGARAGEPIPQPAPVAAEATRAREPIPQLAPVAAEATTPGGKTPPRQARSSVTGSGAS